MKNSERIWAVIPAYNEEKRIGEITSRTRAFCRNVLVVDDGSKDETARAAFGAGATVFIHSRNAGKGRALKNAFNSVLEKGCEAVITLDADGQHLPEEIEGLIDAFEEGNADIVVGSRMARPTGMPFIRRFTNRFSSAVVSYLAGQRITDSQSGFRLISKKVVQEVPMGADRFEAESEILVGAARRGFRIKEVAVTSVYGDERSKIHPFLDTVRFFRFALKALRASPRPDVSGQSPRLKL